MDVDVRYFEGANAEGKAGQRLGHLVDRLKKDQGLKGLPITFTACEFNTYAAFTAYNSTTRELKREFSTPSEKAPKELGKGNFNRSVLIGYSNGGLAITKMVGGITSKVGTLESPGIQMDLVMTIDPVAATRSFLIVNTPEVLNVRTEQTGFKGPAITKWINWYQRSDTESFFKGIPGSSIHVVDNTTPPMLTPILGFDNMDRIVIRDWIGVAPYESELLNRSRFGKHPERAHTGIIKDSIIYERIVSELLKLAKSPFRDNPVLKQGRYLEDVNAFGPSHPGSRK